MENLRFTVNWPTGPVVCCDAHAKKLMGLAEKWQLRDAVESAPAHPALPCITCTGEADRREDEPR